MTADAHPGPRQGWTPNIKIDRKLIRQCVHCGLCLDACPTYRVLGNELDSPRGRIYQIKALADGRIKPDDPNLREHIYRCLDCRACETACPSGVQYGRLVEAARAEIASASAAETATRGIVLNTLISTPPLLDAAGYATRVYQKSGLQKVIRVSRVLDVLPGPLKKLGELERMLPTVQGGIVQRYLPELAPAIGTRTHRVAFIAGCVAQQFFGETNQATIRVLQRNGCDVITPRDQRCCGALHVHAGERAKAIELAKQNIEAFERTGADFYIVNAAGCGSTLKEYGELLEREPGWDTRAHEFASKMRDVNEFLADSGGLRGNLGEIKARVTYQDACHLAHGQRVREQPRALIRQIPGLELVEMPHSDYCCGSAGIYNITQPEMAAVLLEQKMDAIISTGTTLVVAPNPGCIIQIANGVRSRGVPLEVLHPIDLIERAYRLAERTDSRPIEA